MRKYIIIFLVIVIMFGGLKSVRELTDLAIVRSIGIDKSEDGEYVINAIVIDTSKEEEDSGIKYTSKGKSVQEAARNMVDVSPKKLYIAHMENLIISEEIAKNEMENTLDFFIRDNEGSNSFYLFIANGCKAEDIIDVINKDNIDMISFLKSSQKYKGNSNLKTLNNILKDVLEEGTQMCVNSLKIEDGNLCIGDLAYFSEWQMMGFLTSNESILYNMLINQIENTIITIGEGDDLVVAEIVNSKTKTDIEDNNVKIKINIETNITQIGKNIKFTTYEEIEKIENQFEEELKNRVYDFYAKIKDEYKTDILSFKNLLYRKKSDLYNDENYLEKLNLDVETNVKVLSQGGVKKVW